MDLHKLYYDSYAVPRTVLQMVKLYPEWAGNRIQELEKEIERIEKLMADASQLQVPALPEGWRYSSLRQLPSGDWLGCARKGDVKTVFVYGAKSLPFLLQKLARKARVAVV